jgi:hypothetical protein
MDRPRDVAAAFLLAVVIALVGSSVPAPIEARPTIAADEDTGSPPENVLTSTTPAPTDRTPVSTAGRSSPDLVATYVGDLRIHWATRRIRVTSTAVIRNTSGSPIDRVELNTVAAKLGSMRLEPVTVDGIVAPATSVHGQTIVIPLGRSLGPGATTTIRARYRATLRSGLGGSDWMFTRTNGVVDLYRWLPWVSRRTPFDRPNHGDPFVTPSSPSVTVRIRTSRRLDLATTGQRVTASADGLDQTFVAHDVRDFTVTAATDYRTKSRTVRDSVVRVYYRPGAPGGAMLDAAVDAFDALADRLGPYPQHVYKVVQSAGGYGMESPALTWIPPDVPRRNLAYLIAHETAHQWFYGVVGNDQAREPFADEAAADFAARSILGSRRASRCSAGRLDLAIYDYSSVCYYERIYIRGGNLLDRARRSMGSKAFWTALRGYVAANQNELVHTSTLLDALDAATPIDLGERLFAKRFPRLY